MATLPLKSRQADLIANITGEGGNYRLHRSVFILPVTPGAEFRGGGSGVRAEVWESGGGSGVWAEVREFGRRFGVRAEVWEFGLEFGRLGGGSGIGLEVRKFGLEFGNRAMLGQAPFSGSQAA